MYVVLVLLYYVFCMLVLDWYVIVLNSSFEMFFYVVFFSCCLLCFLPFSVPPRAAAYCVVSSTVSVFPNMRYISLHLCIVRAPLVYFGCSSSVNV